MSTQPRITVITPTINQARYLERTICSVLDQGCAGVEFIVIDGGSRDGTAEVLRRYDGDITATIHHARATVPQLINRTLLSANGEIVAVLPAGDLYLPFAMQRVAERFEAADRPSWVVAGTLAVDADDRFIEQPATHAPKNLRDHLGSFTAPAPFAANFYSRSLLESFGGFRDGLAHHGDFEYTARLLADGEAPASLDQTVSCHRTYTNVTTQDRLVRQREHSQLIIEYTRRLAAVDHARGRRNRRKSHAA
jgi:glycosyltransferase involved in cell wall biosynthesis